MPWNRAQNKLFRAAEHDPTIARSAGIPQATAKKLAHEGVATRVKAKRGGKVATPKGRKA